MYYLKSHFREAIDRSMRCFSHNTNKYYISGDINVFHTGQYFTFLYYLSNTIYRNEISLEYETARKICDKLYGLNKVVSSCDLYYEISLPEYFYVEHPVGSVIGRAKIGNGFFFMQGCTVGGNNMKYPTIGENVWMYSNSKILGNCHIGDHVICGANCYVKDMDIPSNSLVFGQYPIKYNQRESRRRNKTETSSRMNR